MRWSAGLKNKLIRVFLDGVLLAFSGLLALLIRFDFVWGSIPREVFGSLSTRMPIHLCALLIVFVPTHMYRYSWDSVSLYDVSNMFLAVILEDAITEGLCYLLGLRLSLAISFMLLLFQLVFLIGVRYSVRLLRMSRSLFHARHWEGRNRILVIGAGEAGHSLVREINTHTSALGRVVCLVDDDQKKWNLRYEGIPVLGDTEHLSEYVRSYDISTIILAIPSLSPSRQRVILEKCRETGCRLKKLPALYQLEDMEVSSAALRDIQLEDLLGRDSVQLDTEGVRRFISGKVVLITGGGGSIGSELCRQVMAFKPKKLVILDIYENNAYEIQQELLRNPQNQSRVAVEIASVRDRDKLDIIFERYRPNLVFHAAAHKHVPLMESCPEEAIKNNVFGTYNAILAAEKAGVDKFVMISTDKAVNPTNVMGATKQICEMMIRSRADSKTEFCAVRFGNVLGSNGSVVPLFRRQIREGGPVTITDKRIIRYFMLIPEAAQLVLEAGAMARQGEIFVLDMGEPVKILSLAENLIRLSGLEPYRDIEIREVGLRPGEKLYEELLISNGNLSRTANQKIFVEQKAMKRERVDDILEKLSQAVQKRESPDEIKKLMYKMIPSFHTPEQVNEEAEKNQVVEK